ncbi:hypothetical protein L6452_01280 [Arctium lappa]|uniref:Uncharacterized protein n=1 Tax=Arctium lappa TaxID=4217 RepID=A0ACB9FHP6_ARCLA|nr:hypothetical protein L6452_01280 [Arctium lappa]
MVTQYIVTMVTCPPSISLYNFGEHIEEPSPPPRYQNNIEMTGNLLSTGGVNLDKFFEDVEATKDDLRALETLHNQLQWSHEHSKMLQNAKYVKELRSVVNVLRKKFSDLMNSFNDLCNKTTTEYHKTVQRRYYTSQGEQLNDIENQVNRANSFINRGTTHLHVARPPSISLQNEKERKKVGAEAQGKAIVTEAPLDA